MRRLLFIILTLQVLPVAAVDTHEHDVKKFVETADLCEHFLGEIGGPGSVQKQQRLVRIANHYCEAAKRQFKKLDAEHKDDKVVQTTLDIYRDELTE